MLVCSVLYEPSFSGTGRSPWVYRPRSSSSWLGAQVAITYFRSAYTRFAHLYSCHSPFRGRRSCLCPSIPPEGGEGLHLKRMANKENGQQPCCRDINFDKPFKYPSPTTTSPRQMTLTNVDFSPRKLNKCPFHSDYALHKLFIKP
jgi:hypothetical protein